VLNLAEQRELLERACALATTLERIGELSLFGDDKRFGFYRGAAISAPGAAPARPCPEPRAVPR